MGICQFIWLSPLSSCVTNSFSFICDLVIFLVFHLFSFFLCASTFYLSCLNSAFCVHFSYLVVSCLCIAPVFHSYLTLRMQRCLFPIFVIYHSVWAFYSFSCFLLFQHLYISEFIFLPPFCICYIFRLIIIYLWVVSLFYPHLLSSFFIISIFYL